MNYKGEVPEIRFFGNYSASSGSPVEEIAGGCRLSELTRLFSDRL